MCQRIYYCNSFGCGHALPTGGFRDVDCQSPNCRHSQYHGPGLCGPNCQSTCTVIRPNAMGSPNQSSSGPLCPTCVVQVMNAQANRGNHNPGG